MLVPRFLYGTYSEVKKNCRVKIKDLFENHSWNNFTFEVFNNEQMIDAKTIDGMIYLDSPSPSYKDKKFIYPGIFAEEIIDYRERQRKGDINSFPISVYFKNCLAKPWTMLFLLYYNTADFYIDDKKEFISKVNDYWDDLNSIGKKYGPALREPDTLWKTPNVLHKVLSSMGIQTADLRKDLQGNHIKYLLQAHNLL